MGRACSTIVPLPFTGDCADGRAGAGNEREAIQIGGGLARQHVPGFDLRPGRTVGGGQLQVALPDEARRGDEGLIFLRRDR